MATEGSLLHKALPWSTRDVEREDAYTRLSTVHSLFWNYGHEHKLTMLKFSSIRLPSGQELWRGILAVDRLHELLDLSSSLDHQYARLKRPATREAFVKFREIAEPLAIDTYERLSSQTALKLRLLRQLRIIEEQTNRRPTRSATRTEAEQAFREEIFKLIDSRELTLESLDRFFALGKSLVKEFEADSVVAAEQLDASLAEAELHIELSFAVSDS